MRREVGAGRLRRNVLGNVLGSAVLRVFGCSDRGCLKALGLSLAARLSWDTMLDRVWPAMARGIGSIFRSATSAHWARGMTIRESGEVYRERVSMCVGVGGKSNVVGRKRVARIQVGFDESGRALAPLGLRHHHARRSRMDLNQMLHELVFSPSNRDALFRSF